MQAPSKQNTSESTTPRRNHSTMRSALRNVDTPLFVDDTIRPKLYPHATSPGSVTICQNIGPHLYLAGCISPHSLRYFAQQVINATLHMHMGRDLFSVFASVRPPIPEVKDKPACLGFPSYPPLIFIIIKRNLVPVWQGKIS